MRQIRRNSDERLRSLERSARSGGDAEVMAYARELVRLGKGPSQDVSELLDNMGAEAWRAWTLGGEYEWRPDDIELGDAYAEWCDDCEPNRWHQGWSVSGLAVRRHADGSPMVVRTHWVVDESGNWDSTGDDEWPVGTPHAELDQATRYRDNRGSWVEYVGWVIANGRDPLDEFNVSERRAPRERWRFVLVSVAADAILAGEPLSRVVVSSAMRWGGTKRGWGTVAPRLIPARVAQWLMAADSQGRPRVERVRPGGSRASSKLVTSLESLDEIRKNVTGKTLSESGRIIKDTGGSLTLEVQFEGERMPPTPRAVVAAARRAQADLGEQLAKAEQEVERLRAFARRCAHCNAEIVSEDFKGKPVWVSSTGGDACEDSPTGSHSVGEAAFQCPDPNGPDCHDDRCQIHYGNVEFCQACGERPSDWQASEHEPGCSLSGRIACALHHECDQRELIGWQIMGVGSDEMPDGMMSFEVYPRTFVDNWMASQSPTERARWRIVAIYDGDVEEPTIMDDDE